MNQKILEGVRVVELSTYIAGPTAAKILADWGAEVIKVEGVRGDPVRMLGANLGMPVTTDENPLYCLANANKRYLALDNRNPESRPVWEKLLESTDVLLTNYRRNVLEAMGMDYEQLSKRFPRLIFAHVLGYGEKGPDKDRPGFDFTGYFARGGFMAEMADVSGPPTSTAAGFGDNQLAGYLAGGIAAALFNRTRTNRGDYVSVSLYHAAIFGFSLVVAGSDFLPQYPCSRTNPLAPTANCYKCADGQWLELGMPAYPIYAPRVFALLGLNDWVHDPEYASIKGMMKNKSEIIAKLDETFLTKAADEWDKMFQKAQLPAEKLYHFTDILKDEQAWANDFLHKMDYGNGHTSALPTSPVKFKSLGEPEFRHPGKVGEDTDAILAELGIPHDEIEALKAIACVAGKPLEKMVKGQKTT